MDKDWFKEFSVKALSPSSSLALTQYCRKASWQCFERRRWLPLAALAATSLLHHD